MSTTDFGEASGTPLGGTQDERASPKDLVASAAQAVKSEAASFAASAQDKVSEKVAEHTETATQTLGEFASAIRTAGDQLAQNDQSLAGKLVKQAADGLESVSRTMSNKRPEEMLDAVRDFARQNPGAFIAGSVLLGIAVGRMAKSSEQRTAGSTGEPRSFDPYANAPSRGAFEGAGDAADTTPQTSPSSGSGYGSGV